MKKKYFFILPCTLLLILLVGCYTTSYAVSIDTIKDFVEDCYKVNPSNTTASTLYPYINGLGFQYIENNIPIGDYEFFAFGNNSITNMSFHLWNETQTERQNYYINTQIYSNYNCESVTYYINMSTGANNNSSNNPSPSYRNNTQVTRSGNWGNGNGIVFIDRPIYTNSSMNTISKVLTMSAYSYIQPLTTTINLNDNETDTCYIADARLGSEWSVPPIFYMYYYENGEKKYYNSTFTYYQNVYLTGYGYQILIDRRYIKDNVAYKLEMWSNNTMVCESNYFTLRYNGSGGTGSGGSNGTGSGENTTINVDLTNTNNKIDNVKNEITTQGNAIINAIESGEQKAEERQTFWENAYNELFVLDSGDVNELVNNVQEQIGLPSGEIADMQAVLNMFEEEARRF